MGYRIHYSLRQDGMLSAVVSGQSTPAAAGCIARDIAAQAAWQSAAGVMVDLRWLGDKVGVRAQLRLPRLRVAVVDTGDGDAAGQDGDQLRCFGDTRSALRWLNDGVPGGMRPAPAVFSGRAPLAILGG